MLQHEIVYNNLNDYLIGQIKSLWSKNNAISASEQESRVHQVVAVAKNESNDVVGVTSVYKITFQEKLYYAYRTYMDPDYRNRTISRKGNSLTSMTVEFLKNYNESPKPIGMIASVENNKISYKLMSTLGWNLYGIVHDRPLWYYHFDGSYIEEPHV